MATLSGNGISPVVVQRVLNFLNNAQAANYFTALHHLQHTVGNHNFDETLLIDAVVGQRILERRLSLGGTFTDLSELSDIEGLEEPQFYYLVRFFNDNTTSDTRRFPKTDLFRFMTVRKPQPKLTFHSKLLIAAPASSQLQASINAVTSADDLSAPETLQNNYAALWAWSDWLHQNKNTLQAADLAAQAPAAPTTEANMLPIWETLAETVKHPSDDPTLRETALRLIVGNHVLKAYKEAETNQDPALQEADHWRTLIAADVILPEALDQTQVSGGPSAAPPRAMPVRDHRHRSVHSGLVAQHQAEYLEELLQEFQRLEQSHRESEDQAENTAYSTYWSTIRPILEQYDRDNPRTPQVDATGAPIEDDWEYPDGLVPDFQYDRTPALATSVVQAQLSTEAIRFVQQNNLDNKEARDAIVLLEAQLRRAQQQSGKRYQRGVKKLYVNNVPLKMRDYHSYAFSLDDSHATPALYFSLNTGYVGAFLENFTASVEVDGTATTLQPKMVSNDGKTLLLRLESSDTNFALPNNSYQLNVDLTLDNGKGFTLAKKGHPSAKVVNGVLGGINQKLDFTSNSTTDLPGVTSLGIADFRKVEQELCCYVPGEVSNIENIMAREYKEKATRHLSRSEDKTELTNEREVEETNDTTTTNRFEMNAEIAEVIQKDRGNDFGFNASTNGETSFPGGSVGFSAGGEGNFTFATSTQISDTNSRTYAEDVTRRALERILQKTVSKRTSTILKEFEQDFKHGYDNRAGDQHVTGVYRWIDKVYKNQVVNYGKRLMYEFMIPEPAEFFYQTFYEQAEESTPSTPGSVPGGGGVVTVQEPEPLSEHGINDASDITRNNYKNLASIYEVSIDTPKEANMSVNIDVSRSIKVIDRKKPTGEMHSVNLEDMDYACTKIYGSLSFRTIHGTKDGHFNVTAGWKTEKKTIKKHTLGANKNKSYYLSGLNLHNKASVYVSVRRVKSYAGTLVGYCELKDSVFEEWQNDAYQALVKGYKRQLQDYQDAVAAAEAAAQEAADKEAAQKEAEAAKRTSHSGLNTQLIAKELKRLAIEMLTRPFKIPMGANFYEKGPCDVPRLMLGKNLDRYASTVKFFEQAFDWELMSYLFYPYYWAKRCDWADLMKRQNGLDYVFEQFLQAGMSRMVVPVRPGFEKTVIYFMKSGQIWKGSGLAIKDSFHLTLLEELAKPDGQPVGEPWYTTVPSTLNIIQGQSVYLAEEGLPCCSDEEAFNTLLSSSALLKGGNNNNEENEGE